MGVFEDVVAECVCDFCGRVRPEVETSLGTVYVPRLATPIIAAVLNELTVTIHCACGKTKWVAKPMVGERLRRGA